MNAIGFVKKVVGFVSGRSPRETGSVFDLAAAAVILQRNRAIRDFDAELGADRGLFHKRNGAAMGEHQFAGDRKAEPRAARAGGAAEGGEEVLAGFLRHARAGVVDGDANDAADAVGGYRDALGPVGAACR